MGYEEQPPTIEPVEINDMRVSGESADGPTGHENDTPPPEEESGYGYGV